MSKIFKSDFLYKLTYYEKDILVRELWGHIINKAYLKLRKAFWFIAFYGGLISLVIILTYFFSGCVTLAYFLDYNLNSFYLALSLMTCMGLIFCGLCNDGYKGGR